MINRTLFSFVYLVLSLIVISGCSSSKVSSDTIGNLTEAYHAESTVRAKYIEYAAIAAEEGYLEISVLFQALARSEEIHAYNHRAALASLGVNISTPEKRAYSRGATTDNLLSSIAGELWEVDTMYAGFIETAMAEGYNYAVEVFTWASDTEKKHANQLQDALDKIKSGEFSQVKDIWHVCRKCGNTFEEGTVEDPCPFCETTADEFERFGKNGD